jgi:ferredoxin
LTTSARTALNRQVDLAIALLGGLAYPASIGLAPDAAALNAIPSMPALPVQILHGADKRAVLFDALDQLIEHALSAPHSLTLEHAPMGTVQVDASKCTLCATCVRICPANALTLPGTTTQLAFTEKNCTQCGLCAHACPENAIQLGSRLLISADARRAPRVVAEAEAFACARCAKPFSTKAMMARSRAMMAEHPMFQGKNAALMEMCPECRQRSQVDGGAGLG